MEPKKVSVEPKLKYENGKLVAQVAVNFDGDGDGLPSVSFNSSLALDAKEAVTEIVKDGVPSWLQELLDKVTK